MPSEPIVAPLLFKPEMVRALLDRRKAQTRRLAWQDKPDPADDNLTIRVRAPWKKLHDRWQAGERDVVIWVRETWKPHSIYAGMKPCDVPPSQAFYQADGGYAPSNTPWRPAIHMPRAFSRLTLQVTDMRVERLQDIGEDDAEAEGVVYETADPPFYYVPGILPHSITAVGIEEPGGRHAERCYAKLWSYIHGPGAWEANPEVVVVAFTPHAVNIDAYLGERAA